MDNKSPRAALAAAPMLPFVAGALAIAIFAIDTLVPLDSAIAALYAIVVLLAANCFQDRAVTLLVSVGCLALTALSFLVQHSLTADAALVRCIVSLLAIGASTFLALQNTRLYRDLAGRAAKIRRLVEANIIGIFFSGLEGRVLAANDAFLRLVGQDRDDLVSGRIRWTDLTPPEWRERDKRALAELNSNTVAQPYEKEFLRKDGSRVPVLIGGALFEEGGDEGVAFVLDLTERKCAEQALRESQYKLRQIIDTIPAHVVRYRPDGAADFINQTFSEFLGPEVGFDNLTSVVHPEDYPKRARDWQTHVASTEPYDIEMRLRRADGVYRWHRSRRVALRDANGAIVNWYGAGHDIDDQKRAEQALRRSEAHLAEAQRLSHTGASVFNETTILYWSDETYRIWGFDPVQGIPSREAAYQRIHPDDQDRVRAEAQRGLCEKRGYSTAYRIVLPDGTTKHIESIAEPVFSAGGELIEILASQIDVTERKRAGEALRESEAKFRDYAETASDWFWEIGPDYKFTLLTENAFGSRPADRIGTPCWDHALDLETEPEKWRLMQATLDSRKPFRDFVYRGLGGNGSPMYVRASGKPMLDANGEFRGYRGTATDVTEIMRAQEALRESERSSRSAIDGIAGLITVLAPNGELETVNRQCLEYFGRSLE